MKRLILLLLPALILTASGPAKSNAADAVLGLKGLTCNTDGTYTCGGDCPTSYTQTQQCNWCCIIC